MNRFKTSLAQAETEKNSKSRVEDKAAVKVQEPKRKEREQNEPAENKPTAAQIYDIFANTEPKKRGHDLGVYVTNEVWEEVSKLSKQLDISKSVIVDRALREVLKIK